MGCTPSSEKNENVIGNLQTYKKSQKLNPLVVSYQVKKMRHRKNSR